MTKNIERCVMNRMIRSDTRQNIYTIRQNVGVLAMRKGGKNVNRAEWSGREAKKGELSRH